MSKGALRLTNLHLDILSLKLHRVALETVIQWRHLIIVQLESSVIKVVISYSGKYSTVFAVFAIFLFY